MRILLVFALILTPIVPATAQIVQAPAVPAKCLPAASMAGQRGLPEAHVRRLGDMPPATEIKALWRLVDGCPKPIVVRRAVGIPEQRPR